MTIAIFAITVVFLLVEWWRQMAITIDLHKLLMDEAFYETIAHGDMEAANRIYNRSTQAIKRPWYNLFGRTKFQ